MPRQPYSTVAAADGTAVIAVRPRGSRAWRVNQVSPSMVAGSATAVSDDATAGIYLDGDLVTPVVAQGDAAEGTPVDVQPGDTLTVEWANCTPGNICKALVFYTEVDG